MPAPPQVIAQITHQQQVWLEQVPVSASRDPGHWRCPQAPISEAPPPIDPRLCGLPGDQAAALQAIFDELGENLPALLRSGRLVNIHCEDELPVPDWSPARYLLVSVELDAAHPWPRQRPGWHGRWQARADWLRQFADGEILLNPVSRAILERKIAAAPAYDEPVAGLRIFPVRSHTLPPATHTNAFVLGDGPYVLVDPSPADRTVYTDLKERLTDWPLDRIFLTHHHPDHHQQANLLARELSLPIQCSADTEARIRRRFGPDWWRGIPYLPATDGQILTRNGDLPIRLHAVPGHDAGQLAPTAEDGRWMIVGDLIQGIGTVVIAAPEGNMADYFATLERVIGMQPRVIVPSHGQAMGGTYRLEATLAHRRAREARIAELTARGLDADAMLPELYAEVDRRLWPLARMNVVSHLQKLREEGRI